ncbi:MAG: hypothetical protein A2806_01410 [Candidatus Terrybacteria bacterium RIFCSPHIGHO2_01_FULL_48_17]|uniref:Putative gluconeogenesis factor n=1 Tax=Candidatus Terrybacteria bacterium RIFCSPHIGHO2_01_FULL_48_17 TaxID=1802362 RepID=A0A1G2PHB0_9BACT|nr:MAG: hypothetical protein A2806_01410 [Candidatus Terrybacteria bacterium RIFCSPHIGHO2_01_FULL_48_17]OHA52258.1 MAG: hypothetical protein A3A30_04660 [Candidatus Terrybacteria bacterium RIFCSPLOWO2_01_FULL_48_14]
MRPKRIVVIGGGTGVFTVLVGLKRTSHKLSAIVTMADEGGSTGALRADFGILPPGDVRRALIALSPAEKTLSDLFSYRFEEGKGLEGHSVGNLLITALERMTGSFENAISEAGKILGAKGEVIPVTLEHVRLRAWLKGGGVVTGEHAIDVPMGRRIARIIRLAFTRKANANPRAIDTILRADLVVIGPGDLYTSVLPNLLVNGISTALRKTRGKVVYVVNLMTKRGETDNFTSRDFVDIIEKYLGGETLDVIVVNTAPPPARLLRLYREKGHVAPVAHKPDFFPGKSFAVIEGKFIRSDRRFIRHDSQRLARALLRALKARHRPISS